MGISGINKPIINLNYEFLLYNAQVALIITHYMKIILIE